MWKDYMSFYINFVYSKQKTYIKIKNNYFLFLFHFLFRLVFPDLFVLLFDFLL